MHPPSNVRTGFTLPSQLEWPKQHAPQPQPRVQSPFFAPHPQMQQQQTMDATGAVSSRYFTQRVQAGYSPVAPQQSVSTAQSASAAASPLKTLLFSSQSLAKLRPLLHYGQPVSSSLQPYAPPLSSLCASFHLKQSASIPSDLLVTGAKSVAFIVVTDKELDNEEHRSKFVQRSETLRVTAAKGAACSSDRDHRLTRVCVSALPLSAVVPSCATLQRQQRYLFVLHLQDGANASRALEDLRQ